MKLRNRAVAIIVLALAVVAIVAGAQLVNAVVGLHHQSDQSTIAGMPIVILVTGIMLPLIEYLQAPGAETRLKLRWTATRMVLVVFVTAPVAVLCVVVLGDQIDTSDLAFWGSAIVELVVILVAVSLSRRIGPPSGADAPSVVGSRDLGSA